MAKDIINGIDTFEKGVDEIQKLGSVVKDFNETIDNISEALLTVADQDHVVELYEASQIAKDELSNLKGTLKSINSEYDELINLKLYKDNLLDEIKGLRKEVKQIKQENKKLLNSFKEEIILAIKESTSNISVQTQVKEESISYYSDLALKYVEKKEYKEAINCYSKVINLKISRDEVCDKNDYLNRGKLYELIGDIESAMSDYKKASEI